MKNFRTAIVVLVAIVLLVVTEMGRTAVNRVADYREMTAPKSLHQLTLETREGPDDRRGLMLLGAGLFAALLLGGGGLLFAATSGREFGRGMARRRRKVRHSPHPPGATLPAAPRLRVLPPAETLPALPPTVEEGHYETRR